MKVSHLISYLEFVGTDREIKIPVYNNSIVGETPSVEIGSIDKGIDHDWNSVFIRPVKMLKIANWEDITPHKLQDIVRRIKELSTEERIKLQSILQSEELNLNNT